MIPRVKARMPALMSGLTVVGALVLALAVGYFVPDQPLLALAATVAVLVLGVSVAQPAVLPILAMPVVLVVARLDVAGLEMSISDWAIGLAFWPAVLLGPRLFSPQLRAMLWLGALYQAVTLFTVLANPFGANVIEWFHAWMIIGGALVVGWTVGASGHAKLGLSLFLLAASGLAVATLVQAAMQYSHGDFSAVYPVWPWPMHKNFVGTVLAFAALVAYLHPTWMGWTRRAALTMFWLFAAAVAVSQSRQALIALGVALVVVSFRRRGQQPRSVLALTAVGPAVLFVGTLLRDQVAEGNRFNSWFQRLDWFEESIAAWIEAPLFGHGLRYWTQEGAPTSFQPPQAVLEVLASAGVIGLAGFVVSFAGMAVILWKLDPEYGTIAFALIFARLIQGQFDLFWVGGTTTVPFLIAGVALGALRHAEHRTAPAVGPHRFPAGSQR